MGLVLLTGVLKWMTAQIADRADQVAPAPAESPAAPATTAVPPAVVLSDRVRQLQTSIEKWEEESLDLFTRMEEVARESNLGEADRKVAAGIRAAVRHILDGAPFRARTRARRKRHTAT
jgi:hypothetical protein